MHSSHRGAGVFYCLCAAWLLFGFAAFAPNASAQPANDMFGSATNIIGNSGSLTATNVGATKEVGEPDHAGNLGGASVWWVWTASVDGMATINTFDSNFDTVLAVYQGSGVASLTTTVASNDDFGTTKVSQVSFAVEAGTVYYIAVDGNYGGVTAETGAIGLHWSLFPFPANDDFGAAASISGAAGLTAGTNAGATKQAGEPNHGGDQGGASVWWTWTAPFTGQVYIDTFGSNFDTLLGVYQGSDVAALTLVAENNNAYGIQSIVSFRADAGQIYRIAVDGLYDWVGGVPATGAIQLNWNLLADATNDNFSDAIVIEGASGTTPGISLTATKEPGEPNHAGNFGGKSVWWRWTAPATGIYTFDTHGSGFDTLLGIYTGSNVASLSQAAGNDDDGSATANSGVTFHAQAGTQYSIAVDGYNGGVAGSGPIRLNWRTATPPPNDNFASMITLTGPSGTVTGTNVDATGETGEPNHASLWGVNYNERKSVWWTWTAPSNGRVFFNTTGSSFSMAMAMYTGGSVDALTLETSGFGPLAQNVRAGMTYRIAADLQMNGVIVLAWDLMPAPANDDLANAILIAGAAGSTTGTNVAASKEAGEPAHAGNPGGASVWWRWIAPASGKYYFDTHASNFDTVLAVYTGSYVHALAQVAQNDTDGSMLGQSSVIFSAQAGVTYWIAVDGWMSGTGDIGLNWRAAVSPANNDFANAAIMTGLSGAATGNNIEATHESGEPDHAWSGYLRSVWWRYTPPVSGELALNTAGSSQTMVVAVYTGAGVNALTFYASASGGNMTVNVHGGVEYHIALDSYFDSGINLTWNLTPAPSNDDFVNAIAIAGASGATSGTNVASSKETNEPYHAGATGYNSVWWKWTAPADGVYAFDTHGSNFNTLLGVYLGARINALIEVISNDDDGSASNNSGVTFRAQAGALYWIVVDGYYYSTHTGDIALNWRGVTPPANDDFANAIALTGATGSTVGTNVDATGEAGEPAHASLSGPRRSVWWKWTAPGNGQLYLSTAGSFYPQAIASYTGPNVRLLSLKGYGYSAFTFPVQAGVEYMIATDSNNHGAIALAWTFTPAPANDLLSDAIAISGAAGSTSGTNVGASKETGEPNHAGYSGGKSVWWMWTAPATGVFSFDTHGSSFDTVLAVYTGTTVSALTELASNDDDGSGGGNSSLSFLAQAGIQYMIAVDGFGGASGAIILNWNSFISPVNDNFADRIAIADASGQVFGTNVGATGEPGEPNPNGFSGARKSVWWTWTAPASGILALDASGSSQSKLLAVYTGSSVNALSLAAYGWTSVNVHVHAGIVYCVQVDSSFEGGIALGWTFLPSPANDDFANAIAIAGAAGTTTGTNVNASVEAGEPNHAGTGGRSVWWTWTAPASDYYSFDTHGSSFNTLLAVYTGSPVNNLTQIASNNDDGSAGAASGLTFFAQAGTQYRIAVDGYYGSTGDITLNWGGATPPVNDAFANAIALTGVSGQTTGTNAGATGEANEPNNGGLPGTRKSVWWTWTAPASGMLNLSTMGSQYSMLMVVYQGASLNALSYLTAGWSSVNVQVQAGGVYRISVDAGTNGDIALQWNLNAGPSNDLFANAFAIAGMSGWTSGTNINATKEVNEPYHAGQSGGSSVWWIWTAPATGVVAFDTLGSNFDTLLAVYTGSDLAALAPVASNDNFLTINTNSKVTFLAQAGVVYRIAVDGNWGSQGDLFLDWGTVPPPANDDFANRIPLAGMTGQATGTNVNATGEPGEPNPNTLSGSRKSVWWTWTAPADGIMTLSWANNQFSQGVAVFEGASLPSLLWRAYWQGNNVSLAFNIRAGMVFQIAADASYEGDVAFSWNLAPAPVNDNFANAIAISGGAGSTTGTNVGASGETGEPNHAGASSGSSVWWKWTAPADGVYMFDTHFSDFDTVLAIYTGASVNALSEVASNDNDGSSFSNSGVSFRAQAGVLYRIAVAGGWWSGETGGITLNWKNVIPPANDNFANAIVLASGGGLTQGTNVNATGETGEPNPNGLGLSRKSVWWKYTAPARGELQLNTTGSDFGSWGLSAYTGAAVNNLVLAAYGYSGYGQTLAVHVETGVEYYIAIDSRSEGVIMLQWQFTPAPANDNFANAIALVGAAGTVAGTNVAASKENGELNHAGVTGGKSVWWVWTAPATGLCVFDTHGSNFNTLLAVYTGPVVGALTEAASNDNDGSANGNSGAAFLAQAGVQYWIAVDGVYGAAGSVALNWRAATGPVNDNFASRILLPGLSGQTTGDNINATGETGEPAHGNLTGSRKSVWWTWAAPATGDLVLNTNASSFSMMIAVYTGSQVNALTNIVSGWGQVNAHVDTGVVYQIAVDSSSNGGIILAWNLLNPPTNDLFANAFAITGASGSTTGTNVAAWKETGEPAHAGLSGGRSVWWVWTAPATGTYAFDTHGSGFDTLLAVYTGSSVGSLAEVASSDDDGGTFGSESSVAFRAQAGVPYRIAVDGYGMITGNIILNWRTATRPANDDFVNRIPIAGLTGQVTGNNIDATGEPGEPDHSNLAGSPKSVWWTWTAPFSGELILNANASPISPAIAVYTGSSVDALTLVDRGTWSVTAHVQRNQVYQIAVDSYQNGNIVLDWSSANGPVNDNFAASIAIAGASGTTTGTNVAASREPGEPAHVGFNDGRSVWWIWAAPATGIFSFDTHGSGCDTVLAVYTGTIVTALTLVTNNNDDGSANWNSGVTFAAQAGVQYHIAVDGAWMDEGAISLNWGTATPPANDMFANRIALSGMSGQTTGNNIDATAEAGEPNHAEGLDENPRKSVWWTWTAPASGELTLNTAGSSFTMLIVAAYTGSSVGGLTLVNHNWDSLVLHVNAGVVYQIAIDSQYDGSISLSWNLVAGPANDDFANAIAISGATGSTAGSNVAASKETGEPNHAGNAGGRSVWWNWTAPGNGRYTFDTHGSNFDTLLGIYTGSVVTTLTLEANNDNDGGLGGVSAADFPAQAGVVYRIAVDGSGGATGNVALNWKAATGVSTGTVIISATPDTAPWSFVDADGGVHNGVGDAVRSGIPTGACVMMWGALANMATPPQETKMVPKDGVVTFVGVYLRPAGTVIVSVAPNSASWVLTDGDGVPTTHTGSLTLPGVAAGNIQVRWLPVAGLGLPPVNPMSAALTNGATVNFNAVYILPTQMLKDYLDGSGATLTPAQLEAADLNRDGLINVADLLLMLRLGR